MLNESWVVTQKYQFHTLKTNKYHKFWCLPDGYETHFKDERMQIQSQKSIFWNVHCTHTEISDSDSGNNSFSPICRIWTRISRAGHIFPFWIFVLLLLNCDWIMGNGARQFEINRQGRRKYSAKHWCKNACVCTNTRSSAWNTNNIYVDFMTTPGCHFRCLRILVGNFITG